MMIVYKEVISLISELCPLLQNANTKQQLKILVTGLTRNLKIRLRPFDDVARFSKRTFLKFLFFNVCLLITSKSTMLRANKIRKVETQVEKKVERRVEKKTKTTKRTLKPTSQPGTNIQVFLRCK